MSTIKKEKSRVQNGLYVTLTHKSTIIYFEPQPENEAIDEILNINEGDIIERNDKKYVVYHTEYQIIDGSTIGNPNVREIFKRIFTKSKE